MSIVTNTAKLISHAEHDESFTALERFRASGVIQKTSGTPSAKDHGRRFLRQGTLVAGCLVLLTLVFVPASGQNPSGPTLYERMGRYDAIAAIADEYLDGIRSDPQFTRFSGRSADSLRRSKQMLKDQLCALTGGPCIYTGRDMKTSHGGLGITAQEWATNLKYMAAALDKAAIPAKEKKEFLAIIDALKPEIVENP